MVRENKVCTSIGYLTGEKEFVVRVVKKSVRRMEVREKVKEYYKRVIVL